MRKQEYKGPPPPKTVAGATEGQAQACKVRLRRNKRRRIREAGRLTNHHSRAQGRQVVMGTPG